MGQIAYNKPETANKNKEGNQQNNNKNQHIKVLVIDDDPDTLFLIKNILQREGYEVMTALNGKEALQRLNLIQPSIILTDMMMPEMDGWETIQKLKEVTEIPIIILSALNQTDSIVRALELGADDYITKPFDQNEVVARVESVLRRASMNNKISRISIEGIDLVLDIETHETFFRGKCFQLTGKMFDVFYLLMLNAPRLVSYEELTKTIWGEDSPAIRNRLKYLVYLLRQQFLDNDESADFINNIGRLGYKITTK